MSTDTITGAPSLGDAQAKITREQKSQLKEAREFADRNISQPYACDVIENLLDIIEELRSRPAPPSEALAQALVAARAEGRVGGLEEAARMFELRATVRRGELAVTPATNARRQLDLHRDMRADEGTAKDIRALITSRAPAQTDTAPGGRADA